MKYKYRRVCVAGTFDGLHLGHQALLNVAFERGESVLIGITSDQYVQTVKRGLARPYVIRLQELNDWLVHQGWLDRARIVSIDDGIGPAGTDSALQALVVSEESKLGAAKVNALRTSNGLRALHTIVVGMVGADDKQPISATRIRSGVITPEGKLLMPQSLREELSQPLGVILVGERIRASFIEHATDLVITVGDLTTKTILDQGIIPRLMIIDNKVNRNSYTELLPLLDDPSFHRVRVTSGPGYISNIAVGSIQSALRLKNGNTVLEVDGEDDLLALPAIVSAPIGSTVYYGQPPIPAWACGPKTKGIVEVAVTHAVKTHARALLRKFVSST